MEKEIKILKEQLKWCQETSVVHQKTWTETITELTSEIEDLKLKNARLKEQVEEGKKREKDLTNTSQTREKEFKNTLKTLALESQVKEDTIAVNLESQLQERKRYHKETVTELEQQLQLARAEAKTYQQECARLEENSSKLLKQQQDKAQNDMAEMKSQHEKEVENLRKELRQAQVNYKFDVVLLEAHIKSKEAIVEQQSSAGPFTAEDRRKCRYLERQVKELEQDLTVQKKALLSTTQEVKKSKLHIANLNDEIKANASEILLLTKQWREVQAQFVKEKNKSASLDCQVKELKAKVAKLEEEQQKKEDREKNSSDELLMLQKTHKEQTKKLDRLSLALKSKEPEVTKLKEKISHMETYQLRFKEKLQDCVDLVNYPNKLKKSVLGLRDIYLTDDIKKNMHAAQFGREFKMNDLAKQVERYENVTKAQRSQIQHLEAQIECMKTNHTTEMSSFIEILNEERRTSHELTKKVKTQSLLLKRATKSEGTRGYQKVPEGTRRYQEVGSWFNKKVLEVVPAPADTVEEGP
ncbi:golgin subfamily A member 4-like [Mugil cephalus]|uniref:golgin subfamily A member 4-like n=1 Tax=Mugil cephalus TaxID=48193 RepID=UPI001FB669DB|nr:golgin subfamily A member 4-like [Mugil cephalus]